MLKYTKKSLLLTAGFLMGLLQLYILICGCSAPAGPRTAGSGELLYSAKCSSCHRLLPPEDFTVDTWRVYVDKYGKKLSENEKQQILEYLESRANQ